MLTDEQKKEALYQDLMRKLRLDEQVKARGSEALAGGGFASALARGAAQAGALGGKIADTSALDASDQATQMGIRSMMADDSGAQMKQKLYADLSKRLQDKAEGEQRMLADQQKRAFDERKLTEDMAMRREMAQQRMQPKFGSTGKTTPENELIFADQYGNVKMGPQVATKTPEQSQAEKTAEKEGLYRYNALQSNAEKLKALINEYGTFEAFGPQSAQMDSLIYQMAVDYAKLVDPTSVAREGEVAAAQKYMLPIKNMGGLGLTNETAMQLIENYKQDLEQRLASRKAATGGQEYVHKPSVAPSGGTAIAAPKYKDGDRKIIGGKNYIRQGGVWRAE